MVLYNQMKGSSRQPAAGRFQNMFSLASRQVPGHYRPVEGTSAKITFSVHFLLFHLKNHLVVKS
jgi:hypothetical protein